MKNLLLIFLVSLITNFAFAQVLDNQIEELLVNASLLPIDSRRSANAITVIDREDIKNRAVTSVSDLLRDVPGLAVSRSGVQGSQTQIRIRGGRSKSSSCFD
jgi:vitamin B12 transporter